MSLSYSVHRAVKDGERHFVIEKDGFPFVEAFPGGTGPCWNFRMIEESLPDEDKPDWQHVCELDELIAALQALRESEFYGENARRWE